MLCHRFYVPDIVLCATCVNVQIGIYASWKLDPLVTYINTFTVPWGTGKLYAFPPSCVIGRVLKKLQEDEATLLVILPLWLTQVWFPCVLQLLADTAFLLPRISLTLPQVPGCIHPRVKNLVLTAMLLSGNHLKTKAFHQKLPYFYSTHGEAVHSYSTKNTTRSAILAMAAIGQMPARQHPVCRLMKAVFQM